MSPYRIVLADDHPIFREGIKSIIEEIADLQVAGEARDGLELLRLLQKISPDLVIMDLSMPNLGGMEAIKEIKKLHPQLKVLILSMHLSREYVYRALSMQVNGYLLKEDAHTNLIYAIKSIRQGGTYYSPRLAEMISGIFAQQMRGEFAVPAEPLTDREIQVLKLLAEGKTSREIGELLFIGIKTVNSHRLNIKKKLHIKKSSDLIKYAIQRGYTSVNQ